MNISINKSIFYSIKNGNIEMLNYIISYNKEYNNKESYRKTINRAIIYDAEYGYSEIIYMF